MTVEHPADLAKRIARNHAGNLPVGGRRPWRVIEGESSHAVKDHDGQTLFESSPAVCALAKHAVNIYPNLAANVYTMETALRAIRNKLRTMERTQEVRDLQAIVDIGLAESSEFPAADDF